MRSRTTKKTATVKKMGKKTDNMVNKTDDPKAWGDFVQVKEFFLLKKEFTVLWSNNKVRDHGMTVVLQDWPTQALEVLFALNLHNREVKKWIPKSRIVKQFVKESGKSWDTCVEIGNKIGTAQGYWDHSKYLPVRINIVHPNKDLEDDNKDEDGCPKWGSCVMCGHLGRYGCYCDQWDCESSGAICVDPVGATEEDEGWNCSDSD
jgi:hypothetical protein